MRRGLRQVRWLWALGIIAALSALVGLVDWSQLAHPLVPKTSRRYVSLSPAITETLVALGVGAQLVGVSDYCHYPKQVETISHVGSGFTPRYEAIIALAPTSVFVERVNVANTESLARIVNLESMPWLTLDEVIRSTRRLGSIVGQELASEQLAHAYESQLKSRVAAESPRVLLVMAHSPGELKEIVFIRRNSIHGGVLEAAGARNAVGEDISGAPHMSLEQVIQQNPDGIVILQSAMEADARLIDDWRRLSVLRAVKTNQIQIIAAPEVAIPGPRLLELVKRLAPIAAAWKKSV
jgi:iron complex transport system substrate-binding protein